MTAAKSGEETMMPRHVATGFPAPWLTSYLLDDIAQLTSRRGVVTSGGIWGGQCPLHCSPLLLMGEQMSVQAISWVIDHSKHKGNTFVVLLMIANHAKSDGTGAWPSVATICKESRLSRRTVQRCLSRLSRKWKFEPELNVRVGKGPFGANLYDLPGVKLTRGVRHG